MIPSYTLHAFHEEDMQPKMLANFFSPHTFKTDTEDLAAIDLDALFPDEQLDDLFPDEQLDNAEYFEVDFDDDDISCGETSCGETAENTSSPPVKKFLNQRKTGAYIEDSQDNICYAETAENAFVPLKKYLYQNCKWTGCDEECAKTHSADIPSDPFSDISLDHPNVVVSSLFFGFEDSSCDEANITDSGSVQPYTPDSDHCYSQRIYTCVTTTTTENNRASQDSVDSESASETSDDEVDVVTVTEECVRPTQRYVRKAYRAPRGRYVPRKNTRTRNVCAVSTVKAAASALKRSCYQTRVPPAKRRKLLNSVETSPSSSLPSSGVSSLCGSDIEDYEKRSTHNDSERKRREAQRTALQMLRVCIPTLQTNSKAPKVLILNTATNLVKRLEMEMQEQKEQKQTELKRRKYLQERLKQLTAGY